MIDFRMNLLPAFVAAAVLIGTPASASSPPTPAKEIDQFAQEIAATIRRSIPKSIQSPFGPAPKSPTANTAYTFACNAAALPTDCGRRPMSCLYQNFMIEVDPKNASVFDVFGQGNTGSGFSLSGAADPGFKYPEYARYAVVDSEDPSEDKHPKYILLDSSLTRGGRQLRDGNNGGAVSLQCRNGEEIHVACENNGLVAAAWVKKLDLLHARESSLPKSLQKVLAEIRSLRASDIDIYYGFQMIVHDQGTHYAEWSRLGAHPRFSSHYPKVNVQQFELRFQNIGALLFGKTGDGNTWFQMEAHSSAANQAPFHLMDYFQYLMNGDKNVGPMGTAPKVPASPLILNSTNP